MIQNFRQKTGTEEFDIVVANILADVIIPMAPVIPARFQKKVDSFYHIRNH